LLKQLYFEAEGADNGAEAVKMAQASEYDVILMDFQMPVMNGITAAQSIRTLGITTPIIGLTANADEESHKVRAVLLFSYLLFFHSLSNRFCSRKQSVRVWSTC